MSGRFRAGAERASKRDAVISVREGQVEDNEIERSGGCRLPHGRAVQGEFRGKAFMLEELGDETAHSPVVVHDQDSLASRHCPPFAVVLVPEGTRRSRNLIQHPPSFAWPRTLAFTKNYNGGRGSRNGAYMEPLFCR